MNLTKGAVDTQRQSDDSFDYSVADSWSFSTIDKESFTHRWTINNFNDALTFMKNGQTLQSRCFLGGRTTRHTWRVRLLHKKQDDVDYLAIFLYLEKTGTLSVGINQLIASSQFSLLDDNDRPTYQIGMLGKCSYDFLSKPGHGFGYPTFIKVSDLTNPDKNYMVDDKLHIHCRVWLDATLKAFDTTDSSQLEPRKQLSEAFKEMLESSVHHDVVIETATEKFKAHKAVLAVRSPVFAAMFRTKMKEGKSGKVAITDFPDSVIIDMLYFLYSGEVRNIKENVVGLFTIADKYEIKDLKEECIRNLPTALCCENAMDILLLVNKYDLSQYRSQIVEFICSNKETLKNLSTVSDEMKEMISIFLG